MWVLHDSLPHHTQQFSILLFPATGPPIFGNRTTPAGVVPTLQWMGSGRRPASRPASPSPLPLRAGGSLRRSAAKSRDFAASSCSSFDFPSTLKIQMDPIGELGGSLGWAVWAGRTFGGSAYIIAAPGPSRQTGAFLLSIGAARVRLRRVAHGPGRRRLARRLLLSRPYMKLNLCNPCHPATCLLKLSGSSRTC